MGISTEPEFRIETKLETFRYLYDPNIKKFEKVGELMPNTDAA